MYQSKAASLRRRSRSAADTGTDARTSAFVAAKNGHGESLPRHNVALQQIKNKNLEIETLKSKMEHMKKEQAKTEKLLKDALEEVKMQRMFASWAYILNAHLLKLKKTTDETIKRVAAERTEMIKCIMAIKERERTMASCTVNKSESFEKELKDLKFSIPEAVMKHLINNNEELLLLKEKINEIKESHLKTETLLKNDYALRKLLIEVNCAPLLVHKTLSEATIFKLKADADTANERFEKCAAELMKKDQHNKKLQAKILELQGTVRVVCRVRPTLPTEKGKPLYNIKNFDSSIAITSESNPTKKYEVV